MRELVRSAARFSLSSAFAGVRSFAGGRAEALDTATWAAWDELVEPLRLAFQLGDDLREDTLEVLVGALVPARWGVVAAKLARRGRDTARFVSPEARVEWRNKVEVFRMLKGVRRTLGHPASPGRFELAPYVDKAYELEPYPALFAIEGLGHDYGVTFLDDLEAGKKPKILRDPALADLPETGLGMLHAGLGLAFSEHLLGQLRPGSPRRAYRRTIDRFVTWCRENAREGHLAESLESFGLETRCFFAHLVPGLARELAGSELSPRYFWHGLGRGLYFAPVNMLPGYGSVWHAVEMSRRETDGDAARKNALAGVAYAFTMVNMSHPRVMEGLLRDQGDELRGTVFADAVGATVKVRGEITPGAAVLERFVEHEPAPRTAALWDELVRRPSRAALAGETPGGLYESLDRHTEVSTA